MDVFLRVFLKSSAGEVELSTHDLDAPYRILDGTRGFGLPQRSLESSPIASGNGSALRSQRFDETEMMLPISIRGSDASDVATKARELEHILMPASNEPIEIRVVAPQLSTTRRRFIYYTGGLEGAIGSQDSHWVWRHAQVTFTALDPMWYGQERVLTQRVDQGRKPFITSKLEEPAEGAVVHREDRAPTASDAGTVGDVWFVGKHGREEVVELTNSLTNPSFEAVGGWGAIAGKLTYDTSFKGRMWGGQTSGATIGQVTADGSSNYLTLLQDGGTRPTVKPGQWVGVAALVASDTTGVKGVRADVVCSGSATTYHRSGDFIASPFYEGRRIVYAIQVPQSGVRAQLRIQMYSGSTSAIPSGRRMWVDDATMVVADTESDALAAVESYFDGDTPASGDKHYRWTGTPHASTSEKYLPATAFKPTDRYVHNGTEWEQVELEKRAPFFPVVLASSVIEGAYQLNIQGDANAWPIWEVTGPGEDLLIENIETEERIFIRGEFGEKVTIDTRPTIADIYSETDDDGELWERVDDDYQLFPLKPGLNKIKITMVNARPNSLVILRYSETWLAGW